MPSIFESIQNKEADEKKKYVEFKRGEKEYKIERETFIMMKNFLNSLYRGGSSQNTLETYSLHLSDFFNVCRKNYKEVNLDDLENFWQWKWKENKKREKIKGRGVGRHTVRYRATTIKIISSILRQFFKFVGRERFSAKIIGVTKKVEKWEPHFEVKEEEIKEILRRETVEKALRNITKKKEIDEFYVERNHLFVLFLYATGMRISEVANIKKENIIKEGKDIRIEVIGKGRKRRVVPLSPKWWEKYKEFEKKYRINSPYLFYSKTGAKLSVQTMKTYFRLISQSIKGRENKPFGPHMMRHKYALDRLAAGEDIAKVKEILGHENLQTLSEYIKRIELKKIKLKKDPLDDVI